MIDWGTETWKVTAVLERAALSLPEGDTDRELLERLATALGRASRADEQSTGQVAPQVGLAPRQ
jgi:hypothetical protein